MNFTLLTIFINSRRKPHCLSDGDTSRFLFDHITSIALKIGLCKGLRVSEHLARRRGVNCLEKVYSGFRSKSNGHALSICYFC
jgi:hypothetical protein